MNRFKNVIAKLISRNRKGNSHKVWYQKTMRELALLNDDQLNYTYYSVKLKCESLKRWIILTPLLIIGVFAIKLPQMAILWGIMSFLSKKEYMNFRKQNIDLSSSDQYTKDLINITGYWMPAMFIGILVIFFGGIAIYSFRMNLKRLIAIQDEKQLRLMKGLKR